MKEKEKIFKLSVIFFLLIITFLMIDNAKEEEIMDLNHGHASPQGQYHYHYLPDNQIVWDPRNPESQFVGIAFDGHPIYSYVALFFCSFVSIFC